MSLKRNGVMAISNENGEERRILNRRESILANNENINENNKPVSRQRRRKGV